MTPRSVVAASILTALMAATAAAEPIRYTSGTGRGEALMPAPWISFKGADGTLAPGSTFSAGRFVVSSTVGIPFASLDGQDFMIGIRTPDHDRSVPAGPDTTIYQTTSYSGVVLRGHFVVRAGDDAGPILKAVFDSVSLGDTMPIPAAWSPPPTFPVPLADVKLPSAVTLIGSGDPLTFDRYSSGEILVQVTPEPETLVAWALAGPAVVLMRRRRRAARPQA